MPDAWSCQWPSMVRRLSCCGSVPLTIASVSETPSPFMLHLATQVILRLSMLPGPSVPNLPRLLSKSLVWLDRLEHDIAFSTLTPSSANNSSTLAPFSSYALHEQPILESSEAWGSAVEALWHISMTLSEKGTSSWDELTSRTLIWRSMAKQDDCKVGEWVRGQVIQNIVNQR